MDVSRTTAAMPTEIPSAVRKLRIRCAISELLVRLRKSRVRMLLARILHEGFGFYGQAGKVGWTIARGFIAIAMDQGGLFKMRRQIAHITTRKKCNLANPDYSAVTDCKNYKCSSLYVRLCAICGLTPGQCQHGVQPCSSTCRHQAE